MSHERAGPASARSRCRLRASLTTSRAAVLMAPEGHVVTLLVQSLALDWTAFGGETIEVRDGSDETAALIGQYAATTSLPITATSLGTTMFVRYRVVSSCVGHTSDVRRECPDVSASTWSATVRLQPADWTASHAYRLRSQSRRTRRTIAAERVSLGLLFRRPRPRCQDVCSQSPLTTTPRQPCSQT